VRLRHFSLAVIAVISCNIYAPPGGERNPEPGAAAAGQGGASGSGGAIGGSSGTTGGGAGETADAGGAPSDASGGTSDGATPEEASGAPDVEAGILPDVADAGAVGVALPFAVDFFFISTGYMGDGVTPGAIVVDRANCKLPRPVGARGNCYKISYQPLPPATPGNPAWAGVYWLSPQDNWGQRPGRKIQPAATAVTFYAAGATGTESVAFRVGGVQDTTMPYQDTIRVEQTEALSTTLSMYSLDLTGQVYDEVIGGFAWIIVTNDAASWAPGAPPIVFYIDDIQWIK